jgi:hypothetical protein
LKKENCLLKERLERVEKEMSLYLKNYKRLPETPSKSRTGMVTEGSLMNISAKQSAKHIKTLSLKEQSDHILHKNEVYSTGKKAHMFMDQHRQTPDHTDQIESFRSPSQRQLNPSYNISNTSSTKKPNGTASASIMLLKAL